MKRATVHFLCTAFGVDLSIHALVKRATVIDNRSCAAEDLSIHALVKRATKSMQVAKTEIELSIHALVKRATWMHDAVVSAPPAFNPRPREEGDRLLFSDITKFFNFQSTPS